MPNVLTGLDKLARALFPQSGNDTGDYQLSAHLATSLAGEDAVAHRLLVEQRNNPTNITSNATTVVKPSAGFFHGITINQPGSADWQVQMYDGLSAASGTLIGTLKNFSSPNYVYDVQFNVGLTLVTSGTTAGDITVAWR